MPIISTRISLPVNPKFGNNIVGSDANLAGTSRWQTMQWSNVQRAGPVSGQMIPSQADHPANAVAILGGIAF